LLEGEAGRAGQEDLAIADALDLGVADALDLGVADGLAEPKPLGEGVARAS
jgi:hypothetical protein